MKTKTIILLIAGGFVLYNIILVAYALSMEKGVARVLLLAKYAPWLFISASFANWLWQA